MNWLTGTFPYLFLVVLEEAAAAAKDLLGGTMLHPASWTGPTSATHGSSTRGGGLGGLAFAFGDGGRGRFWGFGWVDELHARLDAHSWGVHRVLLAAFNLLPL